jgi:hypothetical protein
MYRIARVSRGPYPINAGLLLILLLILYLYLYEVMGR